MELTIEERSDLIGAIMTRITRIEDLLELPMYNNSKKYKDELDRMINLKDKFSYHG